jgi:hypothetical protein
VQCTVVVPTRKDWHILKSWRYRNGRQENEFPTATMDFNKTPEDIAEVEIFVCNGLVDMGKRTEYGIEFNLTAKGLNWFQRVYTK